MTDTERIAYLEAELATLRAYVGELLAEIAALKRQLAQDSRNSSKPPASDGLARRPRATRRPSGRKSGGQLGHAGHTLAVVARPARVQAHVPGVCGQCQPPLDGVLGVVVERRQVQDLPPLRLAVAPGGDRTSGTGGPVSRVPSGHAWDLPGRRAGADPVPTQYGPRIRAVAVYLHHAQVIPQERTHEALADLFGCTVSDGTVARWVGQAGQTLAPTVAQIADLVAASPHQHADETGIESGIICKTCAAGGTGNTAFAKLISNTLSLGKYQMASDFTVNTYYVSPFADPGETRDQTGDATPSTTTSYLYPGGNPTGPYNAETAGMGIPMNGGGGGDR